MIRCFMTLVLRITEVSQQQTEVVGVTNDVGVSTTKGGVDVLDFVFEVICITTYISISDPK